MFVIVSKLLGPFGRSGWERRRYDSGREIDLVLMTAVRLRKTSEVCYNEVIRRKSRDVAMKYSAVGIYSDHDWTFQRITIKYNENQ